MSIRPTEEMLDGNETFTAELVFMIMSLRNTSVHVLKAFRR